MSKFINPFTDVGFKRIFGQEFSKPILLAFLNSLLENERRIVDIQYLDKEKLGIIDGNRSLIYDILCQTDTGEYIIVERVSPTSRTAVSITSHAPSWSRASRAASGSTTSRPSI